MPFSQYVKEEIISIIKLQKKYCYDGNGELHYVSRFLKEIINFAVSKDDFGDFKLLNSIKDDQLYIKVWNHSDIYIVYFYKEYYIYAITRGL